MKKILLLVLAVLVLVALVACGGETTTETTTTQTPGTTEGPVVTTTEGTGNTDENPGDSDYTPLYSEGIDIMYGPDANWWAIDPYAYDGAPVMFEDHHASLNYEWAMIISVTESVEGVYDILFPPMTNEETGEIERSPHPDLQWIVTIDGVEIQIVNFSNQYGDTSASYVRMGLGEWEPVEGKHTYNISIRIVDINTGNIEFWANFADESMGGSGYTWDRPSKMGIVADPDVPTSMEMLCGDGVNYLEGISGPGSSGTETYTSLFDYNVNSKLCTGDLETAIVFAISDKVTAFEIKGMSLMGANDDDPYTSRVVKKFTLYGTNEEAADAAGDYWNRVYSYEEESPVAVNYGERFFEFSTASTYRYYMLVIENEDMYQFSEIIFYVTKGEWAVTE